MPQSLPKPEQIILSFTMRPAPICIATLGLHTTIAVDGGITLENAPSVVNAGADSLIAGSTIFHAPDPKDVIKKLKAL